MTVFRTITRYGLLAGLVIAVGHAFAAIDIPSEGLLFDLDAQATSTILMDANGFVTNWACSRGTGVDFRGVDTQGPFMDATAFGGRGALVFGRNTDATSSFRTGLRADGTFRNQTVFMVFQWRQGTIGNKPHMGELYGYTGFDHGIRGDYYNRMPTWGDSAIEHAVTWFDNVKQTTRTTKANDVIPTSNTDVGKVPYVYCAVNTNDANAAKKGYGGGTWRPALGGYSNYSSGSNVRFFLGHIAEVIVYNRALTDDEVDEVSDKLMHKWYGTEPKPENVWIAVEGSVGNYGAPVPAYGKYVKGELDGSTAYSIASCLSTDTDGKRIVTAEKTADQRSIYRGYEIVNAAGTVLQSSATAETFTFSFTPTEPVTVRWLFDRECRATVTAGGHGQVSINGGTPGASAEAYSYAGQTIRIQAFPEEGYHLAYWKGNVTDMDIFATDQEIVLSGATQIEAVFAIGPKMLTRGLVFRLDASDSDSVRTDANGYVTNWYSRVGNMPFDINATGVKPFVQADAMGSRGSVRFGLQKDGSTLANTPLKASVVSPKVVRTFLAVLSQVKDAGDMFYPIGYAGDSFWDGVYNYGCTAFYSGGLYNQQWVVDGRIWMDDGALRQYPDKLAGKSTTAIVAQFGGTKNVTHVLICEDSDAMSAAHTDGKHPISLGNSNGDPTNASGVKRCFPGDFGEVSGYDYKLSPAEVRYMMAFMNSKWKGESFDLPKWTSSRTVSADQTYENLLLDGVGTVTVAAGKKLTVNNLLVVSSSVKFRLESGSTLQIPEIVAYEADSVVSFEMNGGTLVLAEEANAYGFGKETNTDPLSRFESPLNLTDCLTAYTPLAWPGPVTGTGSIRLAGARPLVLQADDVIPANLSWELLGGTLDLNGRDLVAADVKGPTRLVNTAENEATLTVGRDSAFALEPRLEGKISVIRQGAGDMTLGGVSAADGTVSLPSGKTALSPAAFAPASISNLVCHLDASRPETMTFGDDGRVVRWNSLAGDGAAFIEREGYTTRLPTDYYTYRGPGYGATALDGKPGLRFCVDENFEITSVTNSLFGDRALAAKTVIAVVKPVKTPAGVGVHTGHIWAQSHFGASGGNGYNFECLKFENWATATGPEKDWHWGSSDVSLTERIAVNGKIFYDAATGVSESRVASAWFGTPQIFGQSFTNNYNDTPAIGSLFKYVRNFRGVISEIVAYSHCLTAEEFQRVSTALMAKWGIEPFDGAVEAKGDHFSRTCGLVLGASATLDLGGMTNRVASFTGGGTLTNGTLVADAARITDNLHASAFYTPYLSYAPVGKSYSEISLDGGWDLTGTDLVLEDFGSGTGFASLIRSATGGLVGPFKSAPPRVVVRSNRVVLEMTGLMILYR